MAAARPPDEGVTIIGAGLAGSEAALVLSAAGVPVDLIEMRPGAASPAHRTGWFAELVCSNSLGSEEELSGKGLLKAELRGLGSNLLFLADRARVPAGKALAVDRDLFGRMVTEAVRSRPGIRVMEREALSIPDAPRVILACGPLPSEALSSSIRSLLGDEGYYFYDAISPIVDASTIDREAAFFGDRYGAVSGEGDYLNLPMTREQYELFFSALLAARVIPPREFEEERHFESCMPLETAARRGPDTLLFGPLRPVGLADPRTGKTPHAVVQLRKENTAGTMYNLVGFQTKLAYPEQERVFSLIPGLSRAKFLRYGSVHRNSFLDARRHLHPWMEFRRRPGLFFAGQITGVEGYAESIASGFVAAVSAAAIARGQPPPAFPEASMTGALLRHITTPGKGRCEPMNANFGLLPEPAPGRKRERKARQAAAALSAIADFRGRIMEFNPLCP
ncbi:MAG TPA: methylenetetrahydrofolate--tRNA-(uracil(54)-C(5))-methyltransferase (FADH(2)-oxidizing) TrmFO [Candidatus Limnocylindrales bacterium]|nr:methylenetetrahydrofolate--tRNA-(uracil(54)-C(5))-methyltransferase (FADH(2)-oxidizing) TrmFO [Candidatus Limnocylindrales bacterium]